MHIVPYHRKKTWQRFILGALFGAIISYILFAYMHGKMYERLLSENIQLKSTIRQLEKQNEALLEDKENLEDHTITVRSIAIIFENKEELKLDRLITHELEDYLKKEINYIIGKSVTSLAEHSDLLISILESSTVIIDDISFEFTVVKLFITEDVQITLHVKAIH